MTPTTLNPIAAAPDGSDLLLASEVAVMLRCTPNTVKRYVRTGKLEGYCIAGRVTLTADAVERYKAQQRIQAAANMPSPRDGAGFSMTARLKMNGKA